MAKGRFLTLRELLNQKFIIFHIVTLLVYLVSLFSYYWCYSVWDSESKEAENKVYIAWTACALLLFLVKLVLVALFLGLSKVPDSAENLTIEPVDVMFDETLSVYWETEHQQLS